MKPQIIQSNCDAIRELCEKYEVARLDVFGSVVRDDFSEQSDIDFIVRFNKSDRWDAFHQYFELKEGLEAILGRNVDLVCETAIRNSFFRQEVEATRQSLYAA